MAKPAKPFVLFTATPADGHLSPLRTIARELSKRGNYEVAFLTSEGYRESMEKLGLQYEPLTGSANWVFADIFKLFPQLLQFLPDLARFGQELERTLFIEVLPDQSQSIQRVLSTVHEQDPSRRVIVIAESAFGGVLPMLGGAPGWRAPTLTIGVVPLSITTLDSAPFGGKGTIPKYTPESREQLKVETQWILAKSASLTEKYHQLMKETKESRHPTVIFDDTVKWSDRFLQMCVPSLEYYHSDMPPHISFIGNLHHTARGPWPDAPMWWSTVVENRDKKKIVFVCQGTVMTEYNNLIIPTIKALKNCPHLMVIVALGVKGNTLASDFEIPENCYVHDFIPYDEVLAFADVFVVNSGYGSLQHAVSNSVPLVLCGEGADKPEVAARAEYAGIAVNLRKNVPTEQDILGAVEEVLNDTKYKRRCLELHEESLKYDPINSVAESIDELAAELIEQ